MLRVNLQSCVQTNLQAFWWWPRGRRAKQSKLMVESVQNLAAQAYMCLEKTAHPAGVAY